MRTGQDPVPAEVDRALEAESIALEDRDVLGAEVGAGVQRALPRHRRPHVDRWLALGSRHGEGQYVGGRGRAGQQGLEKVIVLDAREASLRQGPGCGLGLLGPHDLRALGRGGHGRRGHHVARGALGVGGVAQSGADQEAIRRPRDRDFHVEQIAARDRDLLGDRELSIGVAEADLPIRLALDREERVRNAPGRLGVLAEVEGERPRQFGGQGADELERVLLLVVVLRQHEGLEHGALVGEGGPEDVVGECDGRLLAGALRGDGRRFRHERCRRCRGAGGDGRRLTGIQGGLRGRVGRRNGPRRLGNDPFPEHQDREGERGREEKALFHGLG